MIKTEQLHSGVLDHSIRHGFCIKKPESITTEKTEHFKKVSLALHLDRNNIGTLMQISPMPYTTEHLYVLKKPEDPSSRTNQQLQKLNYAPL